MVKIYIHCKYFLAYVFLKCLFILMFLFPLSLVMSKAETPSPAHTSKKGQKQCGSCHTFMSDLDPHPECSKCLPCSCCMDSPHCALLFPGYVEEMGAPADRQKVIFNHEGTQGGVSKGGGDRFPLNQ